MPFATTRIARLVGKARPGKDRQPSSPSSSSVDRSSEGLIEVPERVVDVVGEDPQADPDLGRGETDARRVHHRLGEVAHERAQLLVEVAHRVGGRAQHRVAEEPDGLDGHRRSL